MVLSYPTPLLLLRISHDGSCYSHLGPTNDGAEVGNSILNVTLVAIGKGPCISLKHGVVISVSLISVHFRFPVHPRKANLSIEVAEKNMTK